MPNPIRPAFVLPSLAALALLTLAASRPSVDQRLVDLKAQIMTADYRADLSALALLRDSATAYASDPEWGWLAEYWSGFASWRIAINGANHDMDRADLMRNLEEAQERLEASARHNEGFADAHAAAASVSGWLAGFHRQEPEKMKSLIERYQQSIARALQLAPDNPRVLWVQAGPLLFVPRDRGGDPERAIALYRRMLEVAPPLAPDSPLPDWGRVEARMSLAFAHVNVDPVDLDAAEREAREALAERPDWQYVRDLLLPQIERQRALAP